MHILLFLTTLTTTFKVLFQDADDLTRRYTHEDVYRLSLRFGKRLVNDYGMRKGERVMIVAANDIDYPPVVLGALWAGGVVTPANPNYTVSELAFQLKDSEAKVVVTHASALQTVTDACRIASLTSVKTILLTEALQDYCPATNGRSHGRSSDSQKPPHRLVSDPKKDLAFLVYSSGTTGRPKGVMISHYNMTSNILQISACEAGKLSSLGSRHFEGIPDAPPTGDRLLACLPFYHIYGLTSLVMAPIHNNVHTVVLAKFEITKFCQLIQDVKITFIYIVPPMALLLAKDPRVTNYDLTSIRMTNSGAAPLTRELQLAVFERTGIRIKQGYGLSETSPTTHEQRWEDWDKNVGSIGRLQPNMEAKFCATDVEHATQGGEVPELPQGETGELCLRGPNVFQGYWNNRAATVACLDCQGWFRTGDVGHVDPDGNFYITDRIKELIKYKGFQVAPAELEGFLLEHDLVDDVAVVGVFSRKLGTEVPRAYVVRKGGLSSVQPQDNRRISDWLAKKVVNYKRLRGGIKFVDAVPKSHSGKLLRRVLKTQAAREYAAEEQDGLVSKL